MFLTACDFICFYIQAWNYLQCCDDITTIDKWQKKKIELLALEISTNLCKHLTGSLHYLPSQIALVSLTLAKNITVHKSFEIQDTENFKIAG